jgi:hypothetical protein
VSGVSIPRPPRASRQDLVRGRRPPHAPDPPGQLPRPHLGPVQEAGDGIELAEDHAQAHEERQRARAREHPQQEAGDRDGQPADHEEEPPGVPSAALALLLAAVALPEAVPRPARPEAPPALFRPPDHAAVILPTTRPAQPRKFAARTSENPSQGEVRRTPSRRNTKSAEILRRPAGSKSQPLATFPRSIHSDVAGLSGTAAVERTN